MCVAKDSEAGCFVAPPGLKTDEAIFHDVDAADTVFTGESIGSEEERGRVFLGAGRFGIESDRDAFGEVNCDIFWFIGGGQDWVFGQLPHSITGQQLGGGKGWRIKLMNLLGRRSDIGILQNASFVAAVSEILIH